MLPKIDTPTFDLIVPSTKRKLRFRQMLVKEEKVLLIAKLSGEYADMLSSTKQVVNNCLISKDADINKMPIFDLEYLFVRLRALSVNNTAKVSYRDSEDNKVYDFVIELDKVEVKFPEQLNNVIKLNDEYSLIMKCPEASLYSDKEFLAKGDDNLDILIARTIDKVAQGDKMLAPELETKEAISAFVDSLPIKTYNDIKEYWANMPRLNYEIKYTNSLDKERTITLSSLQDFFTVV